MFNGNSYEDADKNFDILEEIMMEYGVIGDREYCEYFQCIFCGAVLIWMKVQLFTVCYSWTELFFVFLSMVFTII